MAATSGVQSDGRTTDPNDVFDGAPAIQRLPKFAQDERVIAEFQSINPPDATDTTPRNLTNVWQFEAHQSLAEMKAQLPEIVARGFTVIQLPTFSPIDPNVYYDARWYPKQLSAYAPMNHHEVRPDFTGYRGCTHERYLAGSCKTNPDQVEEWVKVAEFVAYAKSLGLEVIGDLVLDHVARGAIDYYDSVDPGFLVKKDGKPFSPGPPEDPWFDIVQLDTSNEAVIQYLAQAADMMRLAGIEVYRADAALWIKDNITFFNKFMASSDAFADQTGYSNPYFYAEALCGDCQDGVFSSLVTEAHFPAITNSFWWTQVGSKDGAFNNAWALSKRNLYHGLGVDEITFVGSNDENNLFNTITNAQQRLTQVAFIGLTGSPTWIVHEDTFTPGQNRPSVFLEAALTSRTMPWQGDPAEVRVVTDLVTTINRLRSQYPVFREGTTIDFHSEGTSIARYVLRDGGQEAVIVINTGDTPQTYAVPTEYKDGLFLVGANNGTLQKGPGQPEANYQLSAKGFEVFIRDMP